MFALQTLFYSSTRYVGLVRRGGFRERGRGRGVDALSPLQGFDPLCRPKGSPLCTILRYPFLVMDPKIFLQPPMYTYFEGGERAEKTQFFGQNFFKKCLKTPFLAFFQNFACGAENLSKIGTKQCLGRARKINLVDLKKRSTIFLKIF